MAKNNKGVADLFTTCIVLIVGMGFGLAFLHAKHIDNVAQFMTYIHQSSDKTDKCVNEEVDTNNQSCLIRSNQANKSTNNADNMTEQSPDLSDKELGYSGPTEGQPYLDTGIKKTKQAFTDTLNKLTINSGKTQQFDERAYPHFVNSQSNPCWSSKNTILYDEHVKGTITMQDAYRHNTKDISKACTITSGTWIDSYTGNKLSQNNVNLDFVIPLQYANNHGATKWGNQTKQAFANDANNFVVVSNSSISKRHTRTPGKWLPNNNKLACILSKKFISVANKYNLSITHNDKTALNKAISKCTK